MTEHTTTLDLQSRWSNSLMDNYGVPRVALVRGEGAVVTDADGKQYLDLLAGIAVNALGHGHPALVSALSKQAAEAVHVSNFFTSEVQIGLAERLLRHSGAPDGSAVFFCNSGTEAVEAAIKLS
ncbi:MAG: aminotransferase class III-fold pyridoxal phosphate-dependent enzyme, partial [Rhodococcus fascians]